MIMMVLSAVSRCENGRMYPKKWYKAASDGAKYLSEALELFRLLQNAKRRFRKNVAPVAVHTVVQVRDT